MSDRDTCAAHGCQREPTGTSQFCQRHLQPSAELCRTVWRAVTAAQEPGTRHATISLRELAEQHGSHQSTMWRAVLTLERLGYLRRYGPGRLIVIIGFGEVCSVPATEPV
jgi:predicted transcriptional regulator of viral defense system